MVIMIIKLFKISVDLSRILFMNIHSAISLHLLSQIFIVLFTFPIPWFS